MVEQQHSHQQQHQQRWRALSRLVIALAFLSPDRRPHVAHAQAPVIPGGTNYYTHMMGGCSSPPVTVQYIVGQCLNVPGPNAIQYQAQNSPNGLFVSLTQTTYVGSNCSMDKSNVKSTTQLYNDPWVCNKGGTAGNVNTASTSAPNPAVTAPTAVYSIVRCVCFVCGCLFFLFLSQRSVFLDSQYTDQPTCSAFNGGYLQFMDNTARTQRCHQWYPTRQNLVVNCVQAPIKGTQQVSLRPIFNFYDWSDTTCSKRVVRTILGTADNNYQLNGCNITANSTASIPMTAQCPGCLSANGCVYGNAAARSVASGLVTVLVIAATVAMLLPW